MPPPSSLSPVLVDVARGAAEVGGGSLPTSTFSHPWFETCRSGVLLLLLILLISRLRSAEQGVEGARRFLIFLSLQIREPLACALHGGLPSGGFFSF